MTAARSEGREVIFHKYGGWNFGPYAVCLAERIIKNINCFYRWKKVTCNKCLKKRGRVRGKG